MVLCDFHALLTLDLLELGTRDLGLVFASLSQLEPIFSALRMYAYCPPAVEFQKTTVMLLA
jgi:hypothetical protein